MENIIKVLLSFFCSTRGGVVSVDKMAVLQAGGSFKNHRWFVLISWMENFESMRGFRSFFGEKTTIRGRAVQIWEDRLCF